MGRLFGTDGVRGIANSDLSCELAMGIGRAVASVLMTEDHKPKILVGADTRASSEMLMAAISTGLCSVGANVVLLGVVPTPAVAYLIGKYGADAGVMISASHNPAEYNGIKVFNADGFKLPDALEEQVEAIILDQAPLCELPLGGGVGRITTAESAIDDYIEHLVSSIDGTLEGLHVAVDCANGSASVTAKKLFGKLGLKCDFMAIEPNGTNINANCGSTHMEGLMEYVRANGLDAGLAFDGDADRFLCVDENGEMIDGDMIMAICSKDMADRNILKRKTVVGTVMTNFGFGKFCEENGINFTATKVGDRFVLEKMLQEGYSLGGEQSGHIIFREYATTGDGQLTAIQLLSLMKRKQQKLSSLASVMTRYPQTIINLRVSAEGKLKFYTDSAIKKSINEAKEILGDNGRILVRPSGTEPLIRVMVECMDSELMEAQARVVADVIEQRLGKA